MANWLNERIVGNDVRLSRKVRLRRCLVSRESLEVKFLIRFVLSPDGRVVPDLRERLPGRGCWVEARADSLATAIYKRLFSRAFGCAVDVGDDLSALVEKELYGAAIGSLCLARKAGAVILGDFRVREAARKGHLACVLQAVGGSSNSFKKLCSALSVGGRTDWIFLPGMFTPVQLSEAMGFPNVIHAALPSTKTGRAFSEKIFKLAHFRGDHIVSPLDEGYHSNCALSYRLASDTRVVE